MTAAAKAAGGGALGQWLTYDVPRAILADEPFPPRPQRGRSKSASGWLGKLFGA
jgi:hypothetical protein